MTYCHEAWSCRLFAAHNESCSLRTGTSLHEVGQKRPWLTMSITDIIKHPAKCYDDNIRISNVMIMISGYQMLWKWYRYINQWRQKILVKTDTSYRHTTISILWRPLLYHTILITVLSKTSTSAITQTTKQVCTTEPKTFNHFFSVRFLYHYMWQQPYTRL